jgi:hypothetical protein
MNKAICILLLLPFIGQAQSTELNVFSSSGNHFSNGSVEVSFTIGETVISTESNTNNTLTQGFHQTNWVFMGVENFESTLEISVFPNPSSDDLFIQTTYFEGLNYELYDAQGKLVLEGALTEETTRLSISKLAPAQYNLSIRSGKQLNKTFKLIKTQ